MLHLTIEERKREGAHYTPSVLADFVAKQICEHADFQRLKRNPIRILDPAVGGGELLQSLLASIRKRTSTEIEACGFDTDITALDIAKDRIDGLSVAGLSTEWKGSDFLDFVLDRHLDGLGPLFVPEKQEGQFDLVIANPPYVRTQVLGQSKARRLAAQFQIEGRVDLYHAFLLAMSRVLKPGGVAGVIVSNRFLSTQGGASVRRGLLERYNLKHIWDLGDTKLFEAAVLPAVLVMQKPYDRKQTQEPAKFTAIYSTKTNGDESYTKAENIFAAIDHEGTITTQTGIYNLQQGVLDSGISPGDVWRVSNASTENWLNQIDAHTALRFSDVGKVRVGVKTTADKVFIRHDWNDETENNRPELLRPLITHHEAQRFHSKVALPEREILYTHCIKNGKRAPVNLEEYPNSKDYLEKHRERLQERTYVRKAGREWFEIWVPHNPQEWDKPKIVFRDISEHPVFWIDLSGAVVNGDCYWISPSKPENENLLWLILGVANSEFIEEYYDKRFNNKLYAGRRRFMTQYVEQFPLPDPNGKPAHAISECAREIYREMVAGFFSDRESELNQLVYQAFGL